MSSEGKGKDVECGNWMKDSESLHMIYRNSTDFSSQHIFFKKTIFCSEDDEKKVRMQSKSLAPLV